MSKAPIVDPQHSRGCGPNARKGCARKRLKAAHRRSERRMPLKEFARGEDTPDAATWMRNKRMTKK